ncbi:MAG: tagaturonate epimerase family protein, partial [Bacteroidales bacterium]|nr:tagaturonate epimerase family protein [Bacteroidales bacterium]
MSTIEKYSFGIGDRFTRQGKAQLKAIIEANRLGFPVVPVWNKSNREHQIVKTLPADTWSEAEESTEGLGYSGNWYVDADHINLGSVDAYIEYSNFFTLDVADYIGKQADEQEAEELRNKFEPFLGDLRIPGIDESFPITDALLNEVVSKFCHAISEAAKIYKRIKEVRGADDFITEVSMDEVEQAQSPVELFFILMMIRHYGIPAQTIAPKFTGRFN